jgi:hypothetical protein
VGQADLDQGRAQRLAVAQAERPAGVDHRQVPGLLGVEVVIAGGATDRVAVRRGDAGADQAAAAVGAAGREDRDLDPRADQGRLGRGLG